MNHWTRREFLRTSLAGAGLAWLGQSTGWSQQISSVERRIMPLATAEERLRQPDIWVLEVLVKPLRMIRVALPDPRTGETSERLIWYLCYRAVNRPIEVKESPNELPPSDQELARKTRIFIPEFTLITSDTDRPKRYIDRVMPVAQEAINRREKLPYKNAIEVVGEIPPPVPYDEPVGDQQILGVATWRTIDPKVDRFKVYLTGFSNGYEVVTGPKGEEIVKRKTLVLEYWRPGDEFEQTEREIRLAGEPEWIYR